MAGIIKASINLSAIPKDKIIEGKKGKYLPITITVNKIPYEGQATGQQAKPVAAEPDLPF